MERKENKFKLGEIISSRGKGSLAIIVVLSPVCLIRLKYSDKKKVLL